MRLSFVVQRPPAGSGGEIYDRLVLTVDDPDEAVVRLT
jgi:hypothetical protein